MEKKRNNKPTLKEAVLGFIITMGVIVLGLRMKAGMEMPLMLGAITAAMVSLYLGNKWNDIQESIVDGIANTAVTNIILIFSGILVGVWILGGAVPTLIYYGIQLISPKFFLPITFLLACLTSVATGTSFGTIATIGVGSLGIGTGLGIPTAMTIGAVVSGSFFGDKMSPISDTTNIAPAMAGGDLFEHIGSMLWTTIPAAIVAAVAYTFLGLKHSGGNIDYELINQISATLDNNFNISLLTLLPFVLLLILSIKKVPGIITLAVVSAFSYLCAIFTQGVTFRELMKASVSGYKSQTGMELIDKILSRGGISMLMGVIVLIIISTSIGGILERSKILQVIVEAMLKKVKTHTGLILSTMLSCYAVVGATGNMVVGMILPGRTFRPAYEKMDVHSKVLSRTLEDVCTLGNSIIPWGGAALFIQGVFGTDLSYIPYAILNYTVPLFSIILAVTGIGVWNREGTPVNELKTTAILETEH